MYRLTKKSVFQISCEAGNFHVVKYLKEEFGLSVEDIDVGYVVTPQL